jgi:hypothetical protein
MQSLLINSEKRDPKTIANAFNTFFLTITENLKVPSSGER